MEGKVVRTSGAYRDPKTKSDLIDKMMSRDFSGDLQDLAINRDLRMSRTKPNVMQLTFGASGKVFELVIRKPRGPRSAESLKVKAGAKKGGRTGTVKRGSNKRGRVTEDSDTGTEGRRTAH